MEHVAKLWMQIVKLLGYCPAVADFDTLSATELASFSHAEKLVELLVLHFFGMAAVEEDAGVCFATQSYLKGLVASLRSQVLEVTALWAFPPRILCLRQHGYPPAVITSLVILCIVFSFFTTYLNKDTGCFACLVRCVLWWCLRRAEVFWAGVRVEDTLKMGDSSLGPVQWTVCFDVGCLWELKCPHSREYRVIFMNNLFFRLSY